MRPCTPPRFAASANGLRLHRPRSPTGARSLETSNLRTSDLVLAIVGVALLGGLALAALSALAAGI